MCYHILSKAAGKVNDDKLPRGVVERATLLDVYWGHLKGFQKPLHSDNNPFHHYLAKVKNVADARQHSSILWDWQQLFSTGKQFANKVVQKFFNISLTKMLQNWLSMLTIYDYVDCRVSSKSITITLKYKLCTLLNGTGVWIKAAFKLRFCDTN